MPKLKKSADRAISSAVSAPRGTSIIVPNVYSTFAPARRSTSRASASSSAARTLELVHVADERDHDLRRSAGRPRAAPRSRRSATARVCIFTKSGNMSPSRQPRSPSIGFCSCSARSRRAAAAPRRLAPCRSASVRPTFASCSSRFGRNSCSGGSRSLIMTGKPSIASNRPSKSLALLHVRQQARAERLAAARLRVASRGEDHRAARSAPIALEEHVLGAAQADALARRNRRACCASSGLSAFAQTSRRRTSSAQLSSVCSAGWSSKRADDRRDFADEHFAAAAVDAEPVAFADLETARS